MHDYEIYGYSLFETLLAQKGRFWRLDYHWKRIHNSAGVLGLEPPSWEAFRDAILGAHDPFHVQVMRFSLLRQGGAWAKNNSSFTETRVLSRGFVPQRDNGQRLCAATEPLPSDDFMRTHKTGNRIVWQLGLQHARNHGYDDALFFDKRDRIIEAANSNILLYMHGVWVTPPITRGLLPGTTRAWLLEKELVEERDLHRYHIQDVTAMALTNAVQGIMPVNRYEARILDREPVQELTQKAGPRIFSPVN